MASPDSRRESDHRRQPMESAAVRRDLLRAHGTPYVARGRGIAVLDCDRHRVQPRQVSRRGCGDQRPLLALRRSRVDVHLPHGLPDVEESMKSVLLRIWVTLLALTVIEVALARPGFSPLLLLFILLSLSIGKSGMLIAYFMHLKLAPRTLALALFPLLVVFVLLL